MTYNEVLDLQISNVIAHTSDMLGLVKACLGILGNSTLKDDEIIMLINGAVADMIRQNIDVAGNITDGLIQSTIVMYVKANYEMLDEVDRKRAYELYKQQCTNLSLSQDYLIKEVIDVLPND